MRTCLDGIDSDSNAALLEVACRHLVRDAKAIFGFAMMSARMVMLDLMVVSKRLLFK